jgi:hypothetical protein
MRAWKFYVGGWTPLPSNPAISYSGCVAIVIAETEAEARLCLADYARENGDPKMDPAWLEIATVSSFPLNIPTVLTWVQQ